MINIVAYVANAQSLQENYDCGCEHEQYQGC